MDKIDSYKSLLNNNKITNAIIVNYPCTLGYAPKRLRCIHLSNQSADCKKWIEETITIYKWAHFINTSLRNKKFDFI